MPLPAPDELENTDSVLLGATPPAQSGESASFILPALPSTAAPTQSWTPHISLEKSAQTPEYVKWLVLILLAVVAGVAAYLLLPVIYQLRLFW
jgi:hypothetical protein